MLFFLKSTSISDYVHFYDSDLLLTTLTMLFRKTRLKMHSLETILTMLIYVKNSLSLTMLIYIKNSLSLTMLTAMICKTR